MSTEAKYTNRLINEKSPYLLQHAHNPVNWFPWGTEAFEMAVKEDKAVFLSIGYSTCHWCHVMEEESFDDPEVAAVLNKHFIPVKVDREERPDIDHIYMNICQVMTGQGGWPLTIIMSPDQKPLFAGSYFPKKSRYNIPGLIDILDTLQVNWRENRNSLLDMANQVTTAVDYRSKFIPGNFTEEIFHKSFQNLSRQFDKDYGGFGLAPKFPRSHDLMFLLQYYKKYHEPKALEMVEKTLESMYKGGIYDHIGFGFSRYATDNSWLVPHFEKMLYDNALLAISYLEAYQVTGKDIYSDIAKSIFEYVIRDMLAPGGGFYSAEDADSEKTEGKFYIWSPDEIIDILGQEDGQKYCRYYDITKEGNFEGQNIPNLIKTNINEKELLYLQKHCRSKLFNARQKRIRPYKDDKILTAWNGLMIAALAKGAYILKDNYYSDIAAKAAHFILNNLRNAEGLLLARYRDGDAAHLAYIDDYAFFSWGLLELYNATSENEYLNKALYVNTKMIDLFWDKQHNGFFFYSSKSEKLITRPKEIYDGAIPSGNSVAALNLIRLANLAPNEDLASYAKKQLSAFAGTINRHPQAHSFFLLAGLINFQPSLDVFKC